MGTTPTDLEWVERPWGKYSTVFTALDTTVKVLRIKPGAALSLQFHEKRDEFWCLNTYCTGLVKFVINGQVLTAEPDKVYHVPKFVVHRIVNDSAVEVEVIEVMRGKYDEDDIIRLHDRYGRNTL